MSHAATFTITCDGHDPAGSKTATVALDRHTDNPPELPDDWRHIEVAITGRGNHTFDVCSPGCGERVLVDLVRKSFGQDTAQKTPAAAARREWVDAQVKPTGPQV